MSGSEPGLGLSPPLLPLLAKRLGAILLHHLNEWNGIFIPVPALIVTPPNLCFYLLSFCLFLYPSDEQVTTPFIYCALMNGEIYLVNSPVDFDPPTAYHLHRFHPMIHKCVPLDPFSHDFPSPHDLASLTWFFCSHWWYCKVICWIN